LGAGHERRSRGLQRLIGRKQTAPVKLNSELVKSPSYRDIAVTSGKTYTYSVSAVDVRGNESQRSEDDQRIGSLVKRRLQTGA
jgi:hypothetical protein